MGYPATLVDKVIKEHGQCDENLILEALFGYTEVVMEELFAEMDMTTRLLKTGFSGEEVSSAIQSCGAQATYKKMAKHIYAERCPSPVYQNEGPSHVVPQRNQPRYLSRRTSIPKPAVIKKPADVKEKAVHYSNPEKEKMKKIIPDKPAPSKRPLKKLKREVEEKTPYWKRSVDEEPWRNHPNPCSLLKEPFFFYGTVGGFPESTWKKLSIYLYEAEPEHVNSRFFSALIQKEGYIHNIPRENRHHNIPNPPNIQDVLQTRGNWPKWDTRTQLHLATANVTNDDLEQFERMFSESQGSPSRELQDEILRKCKESSLVWLGLNVLRPLEPHQLELVLGYPMQHTEVANLGRSSQLNLLKYSFQINTLEYYLSGLRHRYPDGIRVLSFYTGLGEQVIALNKLGIHMKCLVSVEPNEEKQSILCRWWNIHNPGGKLVQIQEIESLKIKGLEEQVSTFGGFDIVFSRDAEQSDEVISARGRTFGIDKGFLEFVRLFFLLRALMSKGFKTGMHNT